MQKKRKFRKLIVEKEMEITRIIEEKQEKEKYLIEIKIVEEIVPTRFNKYSKMFEKKSQKEC